MIRRLKTSWTAARKRKPCPVWTYLRSQTQSRFGSALAKSRSTRSGAEGRFASRTVVRGPPRLPSAPRSPSWRISRATRFVPTRMPVARAAARRGSAARRRSPRSRAWTRRIRSPSLRVGDRPRATAAAASRRSSPARVTPTHAAQQGDRELCGLRLDEPEPRHGRSVSLAKKAAARFRISRSCRSTLFSRSQLAQPLPLLAREHVLDAHHDRPRPGAASCAASAPSTQARPPAASASAPRCAATAPPPCRNSGGYGGLVLGILRSSPGPWARKHHGVNRSGSTPGFGAGVGRFVAAFVSDAALFEPGDVGAALVVFVPRG